MLDSNIIAAIITAVPATVLAGYALKVAREANVVNAKAARMALKPDLDPFSLVHDPKELKLFTGESLTEEMKRIISNTQNTISSIHNINGKAYTILNVLALDEKYTPEEWEEVELFLDFLEIKTINRGAPTNELVIERAYSIVPENIDLFRKQKFEAASAACWDEEGKQIFTFNFAYICRKLQPTSIRNDKFREVVKIPIEEREEAFDLIKNPNRASQVIAFTDSAYGVSCIDKDGSVHDYTIHLDNSTSERLDVKIWDGGAKFYKRFDEWAAVLDERSEGKS